MSDFNTVLADWQDKATAAAHAQYDYEARYNRALLDSQQSNSEKRKAEADLDAGPLELAARVARIEAQAAEKRVDHTIASAKRALVTVQEA